LELSPHETASTLGNREKISLRYPWASDFSTSPAVYVFTYTFFCNNNSRNFYFQDDMQK